MQWLHVPGMIRPFQHEDPQSGQYVTLRTSPRYTVLTIDGKEFFFNRESGHFDGTGAMASDDADLQISGYRSERIARSKSPHAAAAPSPQR